MRARAIALAAPVLALAALTVALLPAAAAQPLPAGATPVGAVFVATNAASRNAVVAYDRASSGALTWVANYSTGGNGTGVSLADSGSVVLSSGHFWLFVVNAGSDQLTVFHVNPLGSSPLLTRTDVVSSGGVAPVSVTVHGPFVFVVNSGSSSSAGNVAGFSISSRGMLRPIAGATAPLSTSASTGAAQIGFDPAGHLLVVTEKSTSVIDLYRVSPTGRIVAYANYTSNGATPYGFAFDARGQLVVSEAGSNGLSSYAVGPPASLSTISASVPDYQTAPCWVAFASAPRGGAYAFTTDGHSANISSYGVGVGGKLTLIQSSAATTGGGPTDEAVLNGAHELVVYEAGADAIQTFAIGPGASLSWTQTTTGLVPTAEGLAAF